MLTLAELNQKFLAMETKIGHLESEVQILESKNEDLKFKIDLKEAKEDISYLMMEQVKLIDRIQTLEDDQIGNDEDVGRNLKETGKNLGPVSFHFSGLSPSS